MKWRTGARAGAFSFDQALPSCTDNVEPSSSDLNFRLHHYLHAILQIFRGILITGPWLVYLLLADALLSLLLPLSFLQPRLAYDISSQIAYTVWYSVQNIFTSVNGASITVSGSLLPPGESAVVIANHVEWTDFYFIQELALRAGMLSRCRYFAKSELKWVPFLGWGLWAMGMPLVTRNWLQDRAELNKVFQSIVEHQWPMWLVSYCEGTRFTPRKYQATVEWCRSNNKPVPKHTLFPRAKGFVATVQTLRKTPHVKAVYDCTIVYGKGQEFMSPPNTWQTLSMNDLNKKWKFHVNVERHLLEELPETDEGLAQWQEARWGEKGELLETYRQNLEKIGSFVT